MMIVKETVSAEVYKTVKKPLVRTYILIILLTSLIGESLYTWMNGTTRIKKLNLLHAISVPSHECGIETRKYDSAVSAVYQAKTDTGDSEQAL